MSPNKEDKKRIYWDEDEINKVAEEALRLYLQDTENLWTYIEEAQLVLPSNRRRTIMGRATVNSGLREKFEELRRNYFEDGLAYPLEISVETVEWKEKPRSELLASITAEEILALLAKRVAPLLESLTRTPAPAEKTSHFVSSPSQNEARTEPQIVAEPKKRFPKVLILEFLPGQEEDIRKKATGFNLELIFGGKGRREHVPPKCNWCIVFRKVSHSTINRTKDQIGNEHVFVVDGIGAALKTLADINARIHGPQGK